MISDDDGHWYTIPAHLQEEFELWVVATCEGDEDYTGVDFERYYRLSGSPSNVTFLDPQEDK